MAGEYRRAAQRLNIIAAASIEAYILALNELLAEGIGRGATDAAKQQAGGCVAEDRAPGAAGRDRRGGRRRARHEAVRGGPRRPGGRVDDAGMQSRSGSSFERGPWRAFTLTILVTGERDRRSLDRGARIFRSWLADDVPIAPGTVGR
jgi:hypothetical protein